ncbi:MAG: 4-phosphoerythronate dehydrogenase [bacterium]
MNILADENIPLVHQAFAPLGEVFTHSGSAITPDLADRADMLLVRSVTRVDSGLLAGSRVRFVATATSGFDHVDLDYLHQSGITFAYAPGCNANAVAEYILSVLCVLSERAPFRLQEKTVGIIGCGHVGSIVLHKLQTIGVRCLVNDPPLKALGGHEEFVELDDIFSADIVTLHVPLHHGGPYPTHHLVDAAFLARLQDNAILINTSRGSVVDGSALKSVLETGKISAGLDVWENEPDIDIDLLHKTAIGSPHIAGYSLEGKVRGTVMIYEAACRWLGIQSEWRPLAGLMPSAGSDLTFSDSAADDAVLQSCILSSCDVRDDDFELRQVLRKPNVNVGKSFHALRKNYKGRREFDSTEVRVTKGRTKLTNKLQNLGFKVIHL